MKKFKLKSLIALVLAVAMLFSLNVMFDGLADTTTGLNGASGKWSEFDHSVYDAETTGFDVINNLFDWPSSGTVLIAASGNGYSLAKHFKGITIPAGLVVDIYKYYAYGDTYTLLGHFDTTDGNAYTISTATTNVGSSSSSNSSSSSSGSSSSSSSSSSNSSTKKWGTVIKTLVAGTPSENYTNSYTDVPSSLWCYDAVMTLTDNNLLQGYGGGKFGPNDPLTRAQLAIIIKRMGAIDGDVANEFKTPGWETWHIEGYQPYLDNATASRAWAAIWLAGCLAPSTNGRKTMLTDYELSLVDNEGFGLLNSHYGPDATESGHQNSKHFGTMTWAIYDVWRASLSKNLTYRSSIDEFPDADAIHKWIDENADAIVHYLVQFETVGMNSTHEQKVELCEKHLLQAYNLGFFRGIDGQGTFDPYGSLTRGQLCQALYNTGLTYAGCKDYYRIEVERRNSK